MKFLDKLRTLYAIYYATIMKALPRVFVNRRGIAGMVIALVVSLVVVGVTLAIGLLLTSQLSTALAVVSAKSATTTKAENITYDVFTNIYSAYSLSTVVPIVAAAGLIITIIVAAFALRGRGQ